MNKFICEGTIVRNKNDARNQGTVLSIDRDTGTVIVKQGYYYWSDRIKNVEVLSYKEVK